MLKSENDSIAKWKALEINGILFWANICARNDSHEINYIEIDILLAGLASTSTRVPVAQW